MTVITVGGTGVPNAGPEFRLKRGYSKERSGREKALE